MELTGFFIALAIFEIVHGSSPQLTIANINFLSASEHLSYRTLKKPLSNTLKNEATLSFYSVHSLYMVEREMRIDFQ